MELSLSSIPLPSDDGELVSTLNELTVSEDLSDAAGKEAMDSVHAHLYPFLVGDRNTPNLPRSYVPTRYELRNNGPLSNPLTEIERLDGRISYILNCIDGRCCAFADQGFYSTVHAPIEQTVTPARYHRNWSTMNYYIYSTPDCPLSNTFHAPVTWNGIKAKSAAQLYQVMKAYRFGDEGTINDILQCERHQYSHRYARNVTNMNRDVWKAESLAFMIVAIYGKYLQNPHLRVHLLDTKSWAIFADCGTEDEFWSTGCRFKKGHCKDARVYNEPDWPGMNVSGRITFYIREVYRRSEEMKKGIAPYSSHPRAIIP